MFFSTELHNIFGELYGGSSLSALRFCAQFSKQLFCILFGFILFSSCSENQEEKKAEPGKFFDVVEYFSNEADVLNAAKLTITKTIIKEGKAETRTFSDSIDWRKELKIFSENGINKPAWKNSFSADTSESQIIYKSLDEKIPVKEITLYFAADRKPEKITINKATKNFLYSSSLQLTYLPGKLYRVESEMNVRWVFETRFSVEGVFGE